jgi:FKBP-type peptidyl-prolyl cis-trans isomerase (trigger factor)
VTVAYKLEAVTQAPAPPTETPKPASAFQYEETERVAARRVYRIRIPFTLVVERTAAQLVQMAATVQIPGFRPGKAPAYELERRLGSKVREQVIDRLAAEAADGLLFEGGLPVSIEASATAPPADLEFRFTAIYLPDLPALDCSMWTLARLRAGDAERKAAGLAPEAADELLSDHLKEQVLDYLDATYSFPLAPILVERELVAIWPAAEAELDASGTDAATKQAAIDELRVIAERRVRLGAVIAELARRYEIHPSAADVEQFRLPTETVSQAANRLMEAQLISFLAGQAQVSDRSVTAEELRQLDEDQ